MLGFFLMAGVLRRLQIRRPQIRRLKIHLCLLVRLPWHLDCPTEEHSRLTLYLHAQQELNFHFLWHGCPGGWSYIDCRFRKWILLLILVWALLLLLILVLVCSCCCSWGSWTSWWCSSMDHSWCYKRHTSTQCAQAYQESPATKFFGRARIDSFWQWWPDTHLGHADYAHVDADLDPGQTREHQNWKRSAQLLNAGSFSCNLGIRRHPSLQQCAMGQSATTRKLLDSNRAFVVCQRRQKLHHRSHTSLRSFRDGNGHNDRLQQGWIADERFWSRAGGGESGSRNFPSSAFFSLCCGTHWEQSSRYAIDILE